MSLIAVVDDSRITRTILEAALHRQGHRIVDIEPDSVFGVVESLRKAEPDLLLLDLMMTGCPGHYVLKGIRQDERLHGLKVIVVTALQNEEALESVRKLGIEDCLIKPVKPEVLEQSVEAAMAKKIP